ncbi:hypothetical protein APY04_1208 [Hyphomicrobium sulfonivorans]|uniref:Stringent starvation protein B n=1 Tax=Hyphomicrobium sulfonivorans TaxID=121290 RepID=A0A109BJT6_HYPSL|nr:ClpXP protease specificity-enhancing factor SspB [Hyphomicrobium sulfonivorans]KWT69999.1 hypothetical protein APY04_1208 [Hyphomicrobium sulfonivorans]
MAAEPTIDYETLTQDAMRGVVRTVLAQAAKNGLPGDHHFYISFDTIASGVVLSKRLRDKYPAEMTIVLQHRFWDLLVSDAGFEVKLTFDGIPERLVVPFSAIRVFFDPSVRYGMQFDGPDGGEPELDQDDAFTPRLAGNPDERANGGRTATLRSTAPKKPRVPRKSGSGSKSDAPGGIDQPTPAATTSSQPELKGAPMFESVSIKDDESKTADTPAAASTGNGSGAQIVSLDAFRKK